jgi:hypothetical protein
MIHLNKKFVYLLKIGNYEYGKQGNKTKGCLTMHFFVTIDSSFTNQH